jgi:hypothetical protein
MWEPRRLTILCASASCYRDSFTFYMQMMSVAHKKHIYTLPPSVTMIALLFYIQGKFLPRRKHTYRPPRPVVGIALLSYMWLMFVPHRKHTCRPPRPVVRMAFLYLYCVGFLVLVEGVKSAAIVCTVESILEV